MRLLGWLLIVGGVFVAWFGAMFLVAVLVAVPGDPGRYVGMALLCYVAGAALALGAVGAAAASRRVRVVLIGAGMLAAILGWLAPGPDIDPRRLINANLGAGSTIGGVLLAAGMVVIHLGAALAMKPFAADSLGTSQEVMGR